MLKLTSWPDEIVLTWCTQEVTCSWSFYPVLNHIENWIKGKKKRFSSASGHMCLLEWRLRRNMRPYSSLSYNWVRSCWLRERVDLLFYVSLTITFHNTVSSYPTSAFAWLSVLSWSTVTYLLYYVMFFWCFSVMWVLAHWFAWSTAHPESCEDVHTLPSLRILMLWTDSMFILQLPNVCITRKLTVWISVRPRSLLQILQSVRIFALSVVLWTFFSFHPSMFYWPVCQSQESPRKIQTSTTTERRTWLSHKRKKTVLDQIMHSVKISASSSWDVASVGLGSSALLTSSDQRTSSRALPNGDIQN